MTAATFRRRLASHDEMIGIAALAYTAACAGASIALLLRAWGVL